MAGIYVHIPFCEHKCVYCDFYSVESAESIGKFIRALRQEIVRYGSLGRDSSFTSVYFGGGTPSLLDPTVIGEIVGLLRTTFTVEDDAEITLEANPGTVDGRKLADYRTAGINRLSLGIQSFHDDELQFLTRIHDAREAMRCMTSARDAGYDNLSIDLIFALPGQTIARWEHNLRRAVDAGVEHISAYSLIVEDGTPLARLVRTGQVSSLPEENDAGMYERTMEVLDSSGYEHYEVSNYARPGFRSRHNCGYWDHSDYLGFGPSAHSYWSGTRWWNSADLRAYLEAADTGRLPVGGEERLNGDQVLQERIMLGLRSMGLDLARFSEEHGIGSIARHDPTIRSLVDENFAVYDGTRLRLTKKGFLVCDEIIGILLPRLRAA